MYDFNVEQTYNGLFKTMKKIYKDRGIDEDKANRLANIYCVQNTWTMFNDMQRIKGESV